MRTGTSALPAKCAMNSIKVALQKELKDADWHSRGYLPHFDGGELTGRPRFGKRAGLLSRAANKLFHVLAGSVLSDSTTGIKMFRRELFERLDLQSRPIGWAVTFEMAMKAEAAGVRLGEVPIISIDRLYGGQSTFRLGPWVGEYLRWFLWGARELYCAGRSAWQAECFGCARRGIPVV